MNVRTKPLMFPIALLALAIFSVFGYAAGKVSRENTVHAPGGETNGDGDGARQQRKCLTVMGGELCCKIKRFILSSKLCYTC